MRVKMLTTSAGPAGVRKAGEIVDLPEKEAKDLVAGGYAVAVRGGHDPEAGAAAETAARTPPETAANARGQGRGPTPPPAGSGAPPAKERH